MAKGPPHTCNVCGALKRDVNHWWVLLRRHNRLELYPWNEKLAQLGHIDERVLTLCGQVCVQRAGDAWMTEHTKEAWKNDATGQADR